MTNLSVLDVNWTGRPRSIGAVLLDANGTLAIVDPGPASTVPALRSQLEARGVSVTDLDAILLTHIHLDHAGATGALVQENPRLTVFVHEFGALHLARPEKLLASAARLYGEQLEPLFGQTMPVPEGNLNPLNGGETLELGSSQMEVLYTPGHASHHVTYFDPAEGTAFVGDTAGICIEGDEFMLPATPPPDIDFELWEASLDAIGALHPKRLLLTHFGFSNEPARQIARYRERLKAWGDRVERILRTHSEEVEAMRMFTEETAREVRAAKAGDDAEHYIFNGALQLSWLGMARCLRKKAQREAARKSR
jgi:glyoxylase-like metal-dependent hydrolase (beta-lactamase superfamily II)